MPIVDGLTSTKMIRSYEKSQLGDASYGRATSPRRIPIFAVSASLVESALQTYIDAGFDGWILKPVDFKRLSVLLHGIIDADARKECAYQPGEWECGGWFAAMQPEACEAVTKPSGDVQALKIAPASTSTSTGQEDPFSDSPAAEPKQPDQHSEISRP